MNEDITPDQPAPRKDRPARDAQRAKRAKAEKLAKDPTRRQKRLEKLSNANKVTFSVEPEVRRMIMAEARKAGLDQGHFLQRAIETYLLDTAEPGDALAERLRAKRAVIEKTVALAKQLDAEGGFDEHFILTVMKTATSDADFAAQYALAVGGAGEDAPERAKIPLNQQLGRMIKRAIGAKSKMNENGRVARAQVSGEAISTYTLLEKAA
jgi:hypothetical protein